MLSRVRAIPIESRIHPGSIKLFCKRGPHACPSAPGSRSRFISTFLLIYVNGNPDPRARVGGRVLSPLQFPRPGPLRGIRLGWSEGPDAIRFCQSRSEGLRAEPSDYHFGIVTPSR